MTALTLTRSPRTVAINEIVRDALSRTSGTRTTMERAGDSDLHWFGVEEEWAIRCEHDSWIGADSRRHAVLFASHPERFCPACLSASIAFAAAKVAA